MAGLDSERFIELKDEIHGNRDDIEEGWEDSAKGMGCESNHFWDVT